MLKKTISSKSVWVLNKGTSLRYKLNKKPKIKPSRFRMKKMLTENFLDLKLNPRKYKQLRQHEEVED